MMTNLDRAYMNLEDTVRRIHGRTSVPVPTGAPLPSSSVETVGKYNAKHPGKAWRIAGMTWEGSGYCADCAYDWPTWEDDLLECPVPVFASDSFGDPCDACGEIIA